MKKAAKYILFISLFLVLGMYYGMVVDSADSENKVYVPVVFSEKMSVPVPSPTPTVPSPTLTPTVILGPTLTPTTVLGPTPTAES